MKLQHTADGSVTFFNEDYQESYHSRTGAFEEAEKKYVQALGIKDGDVILDICFGLGYNSFAALHHAKHLKIIALEKDPQILRALQDLTIDGKYVIIQKSAQDLSYKDKDYEIRILLGPAEETITTLQESFDRVFLDPFSPKKNPELWTQDFFAEIFRRMKPGAKLATYSCARAVRENLRAAQFLVEDGPSVKRRGPSTIALKPFSTSSATSSFYSLCTSQDSERTR